MPPKGDGLSLAEIATLTAWIEQGAVWPDGVDLVKLEDRRDHWSFKALANPAVAAALGTPSVPLNAPCGVQSLPPPPRVAKPCR